MATLVASHSASAEVKARADYVCNGIDDNVEIQTAINALPYYGRGIVELSEGGFILTAPVTLNGFVHLKGQGEQATSLVLPPGGNCDLLHCMGPPPAYFQFCSVSDMALYGNESNYAPQNTQGSGIVFSYAQHCTIRNVYIARMPEWGIKILRSYWCTVRDAYLYQCTNGVLIGGAGHNSNSNLFENVHVQNRQSGIGIHIAAGRTNVLQKCDTSGCGIGLLIKNDEHCECENNQAYGHYFESNVIDIEQHGAGTHHTFMHHMLVTTQEPAIMDDTGSLYISSETPVSTMLCSRVWVGSSIDCCCQ
jgi:hypothetical protein